MTDKRFHVLFRDNASGEELGLMLVEAGKSIQFSRNLINPYAAKMGSGDAQDSDLTEWSLVSQRDWRGGRGQDEMADAAAFYDSHNLETRIEGQMTLGPLPQNPSGTLPVYEPGDVSWYVVGWPGPEVQVQGGDTYAPILPNQEAAQRFPIRLANYPISSVEVRIERTASTTGAIKLSIYADNNGLPGAELASKSLAAASVGTDFDWVEFTLDTPLSVTETYYWIGLSTEDENGYAWDMAMNNPYWVGYAATKLSDGVWKSSSQWQRFDLTFKVHRAKIGRSMSFVCPAGGITCDSVQLYVSSAYSQGSVTVALYGDSGGKPSGAALVSKSVTIEWKYQWYEVEWDSGVALTGGNTYHIVVTPDAEESEPAWYNRYLIWGGKSTGGYTGGKSHKQLNDGTWVEQTEDLYFRVNRNELDGQPVAFARYNGKWYVAAGDRVYEWSTAASSWVTSDEVADDDVTALETWGGYLWAARGSAHVLRKFNGTTWADVSGVYAKLLKAGGGYLHLTNGEAGKGHEVKYTADGSAWSDPIEIGAGDYAVTAMAWYQDMLVCANAVSLWGVAAEIGYPLLNWSSQEDAHNGVGMMVWGRTGCLYIPLRFGLYRWNGDTMLAVGPEQGTGLPAARAGYISALCGTSNWLFAAVNAGSSGTSSILAYNGMGGWHELQRAEKTNQAIAALGFEVLSSPSRLWFGLGNETRYLALPDYSDNPYQWTGYKFNSRGELITSWLGGELLEVTKDLHEVVIRGEDLGSDQTVAVYYEVDRSGLWTYLGEATAGTRVSLPFTASSFGWRTIGDGSTTTTIELASGQTTEGMAPGDWCRINGETRQIESITDSDTFVLATALNEAPASGGVVRAGRPAGREFRLKLVLSTADETKTPKVKAVFIRYQNNVLDRFAYSLSIRVGDGIKDLGGNPYPYTAAELRGLLDGWARRNTAFTLEDPDGTEHTVKVTSAAEGGHSLVESAGPFRYTSQYNMTLVQVADD